MGYGLEGCARPALSRESSIDSRGEELALNLEGAICCTETGDEVKDLSFRERHILQRDAFGGRTSRTLDVRYSLRWINVIKLYDFSWSA